MLPFPTHIRSSGTLDEQAVLDGIRTLVIPAPGGGAYSTVERIILRDFVFGGGRLILMTDDNDIAIDATAEINSILTDIGSTLTTGAENRSRGSNSGEAMASSITSTTGQYCVWAGIEIKVDPMNGDEVIAVFDNTGNAVIACGLLSP